MASYEFKSLGEYKDLLFKLLMLSGEKSDLLIDIVMPTLDDKRFDKFDNFLGGEFEEYNKDGKVEIVKLQGRLFDVPFIYSVVTSTINTICIDTNIRSCNPNTKEMVITLNVMCHKDNLKLDTKTKRKYKALGYVGNRLDIMVALIGEILNYSKDSNLGIGTLVPLSHNPITPDYPNNDYFGKTMIYTCSDFMTDYARRSFNGK
jgi:hypothetical protein